MYVSLVEQGAVSEDRSPAGNELAKEPKDTWNFRQPLAEKTRPKEAGSCSRSPASHPSPVLGTLGPCVLPSCGMEGEGEHLPSITQVPLAPSMGLCTVYPSLHMRSQGLPAF